MRKALSFDPQHCIDLGQGAWKAEAEGSEFRVILISLESWGSSLDYKKPCLKKKTERE